MIVHSLAGRLVLAASLVLSGVVISTGLALEKAFESGAKQSVRDRLTGLIYTLLGAADLDPEGKLTVDSNHTADERLERPRSGLRAYVLTGKGAVAWRSASTTGSIHLDSAPGVGEWTFFAPDARTEEPFMLAFGVQWAADDDKDSRYTFVVVEDDTGYQRQLDHYRKTLFTWLLVGVGILLIAQLAVLRWGLKPLGKLTAELRAIEGGTGKDSIDAECPRELQPLVHAVNALLEHERSRQKRIRNSLDDLAHSLKTPLAVLRGLTDQSKTGQRISSSQLSEQVDRIDQIVRYQLHRAAARGRQRFLRIERVYPLLRQLVTALQKVYRDKQIQFLLEVDEQLKLRADPDDLMEVFGNLLDNACKWCRATVSLQWTTDGKHVTFAIEDDGPGFPHGAADSLIERGARADRRVEGQGIGLAIVADIVAGYGGELKLTQSTLGGARVSVNLPTGST